MSLTRRALFATVAAVALLPRAGRADAVNPEGTLPTTSGRFNKDVLANARTSLVFVTASWCGYCARTAPSVSAVAHDLQDSLTVWSVDYDANERLVQRLHVRGIPALFLFQDGMMIARTQGVFTPAELRRWVLSNIAGSVPNTTRIQPEPPARPEPKVTAEDVIGEMIDSL